MDLRTLVTVFGTIFLAELGDKTQLATMLYAADREVGRLTVFVGAALALVTTSAIGVLAGDAVSRFVGERTLGLVAGAGFVAIGAWTIVQALRATS
jgi:putative Ca2+/H+ antiporter (TMEM165/GDT1 family)